MKCARCSAEVPSQSQFCLRCGTPIHRPGVQPGGLAATAPMAAPQASTNRTALITIILLALLAAGLGVMVVRGQLTQKAGQSDNGKLVMAPGAGNNSRMVQAPGESEGSKVVQTPGETAPNPSDVEDYLAFLKKIEAKKQTMIRKQTGDALVMLTKAQMLGATIDEDQYKSTFEDMNKQMNYSADDWNALTAEFQQRTPPPSCQDLHDKYYDQLGKVQGAITAVNDALVNVHTNPSAAVHALTDMQGKTSQEVDKSISDADDALADVCNKYHLKKDFDIRGDSASSSMFGR